MAMLFRVLQQIAWRACNHIAGAPVPLILTVVLATVVLFVIFISNTLSFLLPKPRAPSPSEKTYTTSNLLSVTPSIRSLPCWYDTWLRQRNAAENKDGHLDKYTDAIEDPELEMSVVIPAYNEEQRLETMLEEAITFLDAEYGRVPRLKGTLTADEISKRNHKKGMGGYEIIIVNDGSRDKTVDVALAFSQRHGLHDILRACPSDLKKLVKGCEEVADAAGRAISVGNRTHLAGSEAIVKRSAFRNILMYSFHLLLRFLTPSATSRIKDTQCGFKLFTRPALPHIIPYMHTEGWIFDVEILMLAEAAPPATTERAEGGIRVKEICINWKEVGGSKLNVLRDCIGMAYGLALLRVSWILGVYKKM